MNAGELRRSAQIQAITEATDAAGDTTLTWSPVGTKRCGIRPLSARERLSAQGAELARVSTHLVKMRYTELINAKCRLLIDEDVYEIDGVIDIELRHKELQILCTLTQ